MADSFQLNWNENKRYAATRLMNNQQNLLIKNVLCVEGLLMDLRGNIH